MGVYTQASQGSWLTKRGAFVGGLIAFHLLLIWALMSGFAVKLVQTITEPIKVEIIQEIVEVEPPPPAPPVEVVELPPVSVPPVVVDIQLPTVTPPIQVTVAPSPPGPPAPPAFSPPAPPGPPAVTTSRATVFAPSTQDYYPPTSIQLEEEGRVRIRMCYGTNGRVTESTLIETSGKKRLDDAAVRMGRQFRFRPGTVNGAPQADCVTLPVSFSLKGDR